MQQSHDRPAKDLGLPDGHFHHHPEPAPDLPDREAPAGMFEISYIPARGKPEYYKSNQQYKQEN